MLNKQAKYYRDIGQNSKSLLPAIPSSVLPDNWLAAARLLRPVEQGAAFAEQLLHLEMGCDNATEVV